MNRKNSASLGSNIGDDCGIDLGSLSDSDGESTEAVQLLPECSTDEAVILRATGGRRKSFTAPPSPIAARKKPIHSRLYINHIQQLISWRDRWSSSDVNHKLNESLHRSESMVSLACFRQLSTFIQDDNVAGLQAYLSANKHINVDDKDENGTTALMVACENGREAAARALLAAGADPTAADADGWTPLASAARVGAVALCRELVDRGADIESNDMGGWTPLMWASYKGHEDVVALLLERGADVNAHGNYHICSLVWAAGRKHSGVVRRLLAAGARPNAGGKFGTTALVWAARAGDAASVSALLAAGASVDTAGIYSWTALLQATQGNHYEIVQMLLEHKPNVNALDKDGCTALALACKEGYYDIAVALMNAGAYINIQDHSKDTCLIHAVKGGHRAVVEALLKKYADVDQPGKDKKTAVYNAVEKGHTAILKLLLQTNPDLEVTTKDGDTALLRAVRNRNAEMVEMLVEKKARVNAVDKKGDTALHIAMRARSKQIVEILLRNPKNSQLLYKPNKDQETPYNIDMNYPKTILGQIFGARKLNTNDDNENMLGYELYSAALADMLSEPSLSVPITVGLYARWGSGKSFLLNKLKEEMKNFARQWTECGWQWSWAVAWGVWHAALLSGAVAAGAGAPWPAALGVAAAVLGALYGILLALWHTSNRYEWYWPYTVMTALARKFNSLKLVLQVVFCHPPGPQCSHSLPAQPIRFHFTDQAKSSTQEGEASVIQMIVSLAEALENQYGRLCTRLYRAFKPKPIRSTTDWRWRRICCIPQIFAFEFCFICVLFGICGLILYLTDNGEDVQKAQIQQGLLIGVGTLVAIAAVANLYTWCRISAALFLSPRAQINRSIRKQPEGFLQAIRPEVMLLTDMVKCLDAFTGQQTRLVVVVDALDSCEQDRVLIVLNAVHSLCSELDSPFIVILAIDPHIISKAVEVNSRRAFSESNIGGWDYLRNMVQLPFYLQNSALRRVKIAQQTAQRRLQSTNNEDFSASLQRSVSARRLSSTSELMSSQERIKGNAASISGTAARARRLRPSESVASSIASGLHRAGVPTGAADLGRVLLTDDYFSDVNPRSMRRLMNVLYVTGRLLKAFQIDFNWYHLASWVNLTEQWPFRTSWIIYHHETYEEHIDDNTSLKHIYDKIRPNIPALRDAEPLMELDRDERKLDVFLNFHRHSLLAADLKIFLPFTINLDPYIKKVIKEEQHHYMASEDMVSVNLPQFNGPQKYTPKYYQRKSRHQTPPPAAQIVAQVAPSPPVWLGWPDGTNYGSLAAPTVNVQPSAQLYLNTLKTNFQGLGDVSNIRLSRLTVNEVCDIVQRALPNTAEAARDSLLQHNICGMVLAHCDLNELKTVLNLNFGDWELFKMLVLSLKELEQAMPLVAPVVNVVPEKIENEKELKQRPSIDTQRSRPSNMEKQVTLEEQMICGALQTLNEEALEDVLQGEPVAQQDLAYGFVRLPTHCFSEYLTLGIEDLGQSPKDEASELHLALLAPGATSTTWPSVSPPNSLCGTPLLSRKPDPSILKPSGSFKNPSKKHVSINDGISGLPSDYTTRSADATSNVTFKFENEVETCGERLTMRIDKNNRRGNYDSRQEYRKIDPVSEGKALLNIDTPSHSALYEQNSKHNNLKWQKPPDGIEAHSVTSIDEKYNDTDLQVVDAKPLIPKQLGESKTVGRRFKSSVQPRPSSLHVTRDDQCLVPEKQPLASRSRSVEDSTKSESSNVNPKIQRFKNSTEKLKVSGSSERLTRLKEKLIITTTDNLDSDDESTPLVSSDMSSSSISGKIGIEVNGHKTYDRSQSGSASSSPETPDGQQPIARSSPLKKSFPQKNFGLECGEGSCSDITVSTEFSPNSERSILESPPNEICGSEQFDILPREEKHNSDRKESSLARAVSEDSVSNMLEPYNLALLSPGLSDASLRSSLWRQDAVDDQDDWTNPESTV